MATVNGSEGNDTIDGTAQADSISANGGDDRIFAGAANDTVSGGLGNDSIDGDGGDDSLSGGDGADTIDGGDGNDHIDGGAGNDNIYDGAAGNDTIEGGDGDDSIVADGGDNSISGGEGNDTIYANSGTNTISGDGGADLIASTDGNDEIRGGDGTDTIYGNGGNDTIYGGADDDEIHGGTGDDALSGGAGNDQIYADGGTTTVEGGEGNDSLFAGGGADTFVIRDGHGSDTIQWFSTGNDIVTFDMAEMGSYQDVLDRMSPSGNHTVITFDNGETLTLLDIQPEWLSSSNFAYSAGPVCLLQGTLIHTERGEVPIENLRPDDIVWTKDNGWQAIRLVTFETMVFKDRDDPAKPILIPKGALGNGLPLVDLITSPQHRILQIYPETGEEVLVAAVKLVGTNGIRQMRGKKKAHYLNIVMQRHSIIQAAGCWVESMLVTSRSLERQQGATISRLMTSRNMEPARRVVQQGLRPRRLKSA